MIANITVIGVVMLVLQMACQIAFTKYGAVAIDQFEDLASSSTHYQLSSTAVGNNEIHNPIFVLREAGFKTDLTLASTMRYSF